MKKLALVAAFAAFATPALANYSYGYGSGYGYNYAPTYVAPTYTKVVCFHEKVFVPGYYGGHYVLKKVCRTVSAY